MTFEISVDRDALLMAMVEKLPPAGEVFSSGDQERWLAAMAAILGFLYPPAWAPEARERAKEARKEQRMPDPPPGHVWRQVPLPPSGPPPVRLATNAPPPEQADYPVITSDGVVHPHPEEAPSSTSSADAVDDESGTGGAASSGADRAESTSSPTDDSSSLEHGPGSTPTAQPGSEPSKPSTDAPAPAKSGPTEGVRIIPGQRSATARRHFTPDQRGAIIKRVVWEGKEAVARDTGIHEATLNRWMREMPVSVRTFTAERDAQLAAEAGPSAEELEAEAAVPVPPKPEKPAVQWPTTPIERRPVDHAAVLRAQADSV